MDPDIIPYNTVQNFTISGTALPVNTSLNCTFIIDANNTISTPVYLDSDTSFQCESISYSSEEINVQLEVQITRYGLNIVQNKLFLTFGDPGAEGINSTNKKDETPLFASIGGSSAAGFILLTAAIVAFVRYRKKLAADKFRSLFDVPIFSLESAFSMYYFHGYAERSWIKKHAQEVWYLEELLSRPDFLFIDALTNTFETHESDDMSKALVYVSEVNGEAIRLIQHHMDLEFSRAPNGVQLFRGYNSASKMWSGYLKLDFGLEYVHGALARTLYSVCSELGYEEDKVELDVDRAAETDQSVNVNKYRLMSATQKIFEAILASVDNVPPNISHLLYYIRYNTEKKFPDYIHRTIGNFLFLRLFCPAIAAPEVYGLLKEEPDDNARHLLILIARVLQNLANGVEFGVKDLAMKQMNDFIRTNQQTINQFFDQITDLEEADLDNDPPVQHIPQDVKEISLILIYNYIHCHIDRIQNEISRIDDDSLRDEMSSQVNMILDVIGEPLELTFEDEEI